MMPHIDRDLIRLAVTIALLVAAFVLAAREAAAQERPEAPTCRNTTHARQLVEWHGLGSPADLEIMVDGHGPAPLASVEGKSYTTLPLAWAVTYRYRVRAAGETPGPWSELSAECYLPQAGDGNADGTLGAADLSALVLELFDGDGADADDARLGAFAGDATGSDPSGDGVINATDVGCLVLLVTERGC